MKSTGYGFRVVARFSLSVLKLKIAPTIAPTKRKARRFVKNDLFVFSPWIAWVMVLQGCHDHFHEPDPQRVLCRFFVAGHLCATTASRRHPLDRA